MQNRRKTPYVARFHRREKQFLRTDDGYVFCTVSFHRIRSRSRIRQGTGTCLARAVCQLF